MDYYLENTKIFKALGDPKRAMIVDMLSCGELCACNILERFEMSQSTLSHHMKILCECGLVSARREGKWSHYSLVCETFAAFQRFIAQLECCKDGGCC